MNVVNDREREPERARVPFAPLWDWLRRWVGRPLGVAYLASWWAVHSARVPRFQRLRRVLQMLRPARPLPDD